MLPVVVVAFSSKLDRKTRLHLNSSEWVCVVFKLIYRHEDVISMWFCFRCESRVEGSSPVTRLSLRSSQTHRETLQVFTLHFFALLWLWTQHFNIQKFISKNLKSIFDNWVECVLELMVIWILQSVTSWWFGHDHMLWMIYSAVWKNFCHIRCVMCSVI